MGVAIASTVLRWNGDLAVSREELKRGHSSWVLLGWYGVIMQQAVHVRPGTGPWMPQQRPVWMDDHWRQLEAQQGLAVKSVPTPQILPS
jgi:hypothetical protein